MILHTQTLNCISGEMYEKPSFRDAAKNAFEISGDSMLPLFPGTIVIGEKLERLNDLKDGQTYVLVTQQDGIVYKRVFNNERYKPYSIDPMEIHEAWAAKVYVSLEFPEAKVSSKSNLRKLLNSGRSG